MQAGALLMSPQGKKTAEPNRDVPPWVLRVRRLMAERGWEQAEFARKAGVSTGWVSLTIVQGKRGAQPRRDTLVKMAQVFNEPIGLWLKLGGLDPGDGEWTTTRPSFADFVDGEAALTDDQKHLLKSMYSSWVSPTMAGRVEGVEHKRRRSPRQDG